jgi:hypothetical protein
MKEVDAQQDWAEYQEEVTEEADETGEPGSDVPEEE